MKSFKNYLLIPIVFITLLMAACQNSATIDESQLNKDSDIINNEEEFINTLEKHLQAVSNKDLLTLKSTMSPNGNMQLILPSTEIINSVDSFMSFHAEWFKDTIWTFETKILNTEVGDKLGFGVSEVIYREPERDGKPYFNRMIVSYDLMKTDSKWYIVKDHASSIEKSTDKK